MDDTVKSIARPAATRSLHDAVRKARVEEAYQLDETADRRDSEIARLELLKAELEAVFADVPANDPEFGEDAESLVRRWCERYRIAYLGRADIGHDSANRVVPFGLL